MSVIKKYLLLLICYGVFFLSHAQRVSDFVTINDFGYLRYGTDEKGNKIPNFSRVGYRENIEALPFVPVVKTISSHEGNMLPDIQRVIDEVSQLPVDASGFRGAILLTAGRYVIDGAIRISASGIVIRGEGNETVLIAAGDKQHDLIKINGSGRLQEMNNSRQTIIDKYVPFGTISFKVKNARSFKVGDSIVVFRPGTNQWIEDLKMDHIDVRDSNTKQWQPAEYDLHFERVITSIKRNEIFIDQPVVMAMEEKYGGGEIYKYHFNGRLNNIGIENFSCESEFKSNTDEQHGWNAIQIDRVQNGWVKNITAKYFGYSCVNLGEQSRNMTVDSCSSLDAKSKIEGGRRYSFNNDGQFNLIMHCFASDGRHDYVTGARVRGPNVFYDCKAVKTHADIGPHHRWAMGTLYDNIISDGEINAQDRGNWGTGHGWSGVNQVFWNCTASRFAIQDPWVSGKNYVFNMHGVPYEGRLKNRNASIVLNEETGIQSLYAEQLKQRKDDILRLKKAKGLKQ